MNIKPAPDDWFIATFPDGVWCHWRERWGIQHRDRGDYECREVLTFDAGTGEPVESVCRAPPGDRAPPGYGPRSLAEPRVSPDALLGLQVAG
jgi:hypothetical protein